MSVPMCKRCRQRWLCIRWAVILVVIVGATAITRGLYLEPSRDRFAARWWVGIIAAFVGPAVMGSFLLVNAIEFFAPVRTWAHRGDWRVFLRFRNRDYHRMSRQWMAGGRTAAMAPEGFPVPPKKLKG